MGRIRRLRPQQPARHAQVARSHRHRIGALVRLRFEFFGLWADRRRGRRERSDPAVQPLRSDEARRGSALRGLRAELWAPLRQPASLHGVRTGSATGHGHVPVDPCRIAGRTVSDVRRRFAGSIVHVRRRRRRRCAGRSDGRSPAGNDPQRVGWFHVHPHRSHRDDRGHHRHAGADRAARPRGRRRRPDRWDRRRQPSESSAGRPALVSARASAVKSSGCATTSKPRSHLDRAHAGAPQPGRERTACRSGLELPWSIRRCRSSSASSSAAANASRIVHGDE